MALSIDEAVRRLRLDPRQASLVHDAYLDENTLACAGRFQRSAEFQETLRLLGNRAQGIILDLGAGTGIASYAFARSRAKLVYALEPDSSDVVGRGAIARLVPGTNIEVLDGFGERIPLPDHAVDVVYARQVLHHASNLPQLLRDCARVLRPNGLFFACREHIVDNEEQLKVFLQRHPLHQLVGGEHAYSLEAYLAAIEQAGLTIERVFGQWDTVINAYPSVQSAEELERYPKTLLARRFGVVGAWLGNVRWIKALAWKRLKRPVPGRLSAFLARKP